MIILWITNLNNQDEIEKFLGTHNMSKLSEEEVENPNRFVTSKEIKLVIKYLPTKTSPGPNGLTGKFYWTLKEELKPVLL